MAKKVNPENNGWVFNEKASTTYAKHYDKGYWFVRVTEDGWWAAVNQNGNANFVEIEGRRITASDLRRLDSFIKWTHR